MAITPKRLEVFEILEKVVETSSRKKKKELLQEHQCMPLLDVLRGTYDDAIQWNLPEGTPPYTPQEEGAQPSTLLRQHMNFKYFVKGLRESNQLNTVRRERMFIDMLEAVHPKDAKVLIAMINKKSLGHGITKKLVQEVFPNLIVK